jgi:hypothetical protein
MSALFLVTSWPATRSTCDIPKRHNPDGGSVLGTYATRFIHTCDLVFRRNQSSSYACGTG